MVQTTQHPIGRGYSAIPPCDPLCFVREPRWLNVYIGEALHNPLIDAIYFDCCCGSPPGDAFLDNPAAVARYAADAQAAFDRALAMIAAAGKWASAWNPEGMGLGCELGR